MFTTQHLLLFLCALFGSVRAFAPSSSLSARLTALHLMLTPQVPPPAVLESLATTTVQEMTMDVSPMQQGIDKYVSCSSGSSSSSIQVALEERKIPTKEEIEAKKRNFNVIFWGGGFVAPFLATVFYFGFKFWEK